MISLYELSVCNYDRVLGATIGILKKSATHFEKTEQDLDEIINMKLAPDMFPFTFQINSVRHHSLNAARGILAGKFKTPDPMPELDFNGLIEFLEVARNDLREINEEELEARSGLPVLFKMGSMEIPFTAENFVQSFSLPNLYFHATTTYDMLRIKGAPLGKTDFMGRMKIGLDP